MNIYEVTLKERHSRYFKHRNIVAPSFAKAELVAIQSFPVLDIIEIACKGECIIYSSIYESDKDQLLGDA